MRIHGKAVLLVLSANALARVRAGGVTLAAAAQQRWKTDGAAESADAPAPPGCHPPLVDPAWESTWKLSFHPVTPHVHGQGDISGGLVVNGTWHLFTSCTGGWCHLSTEDLAHYRSHGVLVAKPSPSFPQQLGLGTGSVLPAPDGDGVLAWVNSVSGHMVSRDGMQTWTALATNTTGTGGPGSRDQARPLRSADGTWWQMMGCGNATTAAVCKFRSTDPRTLSSWEYAGHVFERNATVFGVAARFYEVPDMFPLGDATTKGCRARKDCVLNPHKSAGVNEEQQVHVVVVDPWMQQNGYHVHNVEWHSGVWSDDGSDFSPRGSGCLDCGWWYAARSLSAGTNTGRRLMFGNIGADVTQGAAPVQSEKQIPIRFFTSLPRELTLAHDGVTVHVRPPPELASLRAKGVAPATTRNVPLRCGDRVPLSAALRAAEFATRFNVSGMAEGAVAGLYLLASPAMEESVFVGLNGTAVFIDTRNSTQDTDTFQPSFRTVLAAPFAAPRSGVVELRVYLDETVVEVFASDCVCSGAATASSCNCSAGDTAVAVTALGFPLRASATRSGLYADCPRQGSVSGVTASATVWPLDAAPVECKPPLCVPPPPPPPPPPSPPPPKKCPPADGATVFMSNCDDAGVGARFAADVDGRLSPVTNASLFVSWSDALSPRRIVLGTNRSNALRFEQEVAGGEVVVVGGCRGAAGCPWGGAGNATTCLDSECGNERPSDCVAGPELFECMGAGCTCNQQWTLEMVANGVTGLPVVRLRNGLAGPLPSKAMAGCHRTQQCFAVCVAP